MSFTCLGFRAPTSTQPIPGCRAVQLSQSGVVVFCNRFDLILEFIHAPVVFVGEVFVVFTGIVTGEFVPGGNLAGQQPTLQRTVGQNQQS